MKLKKLLNQIAVTSVKGSKEIEITGICGDSRLVVPGNIFVARKGFKEDGVKFIPEAIAAGAVAIATDLYDPSLKGVSQIIHSDLRNLEGDLAAEFYGHPSRELFAVGVTGTSGKTSTTFFLKYLLDELNQPCGLIGTIELIIGQMRHTATHTTPDVIAVHKLLREMVMQGCKSAAIEVTSHGLDQGRVRKVYFDVGIFTNLSHEHLDYHTSMESYADAKAELFAKVPMAVINCDDPWHPRMIRECKGGILTYGLKSGADLVAEKIHLTTQGSSFEVCYRGERVPFRVPVVGRFNIYNCLAAIGAGIAAGGNLEKMADIFTRLPLVRGRLEAISNARHLNVYVDYAHKPDALEKTLSCLKAMCSGRLITVFGCGGERDRLKRPLMGEIATRFSDFTIVTSDNPRQEEPAAICQEIVASLTQSSRFQVIVDRKEAIRYALLQLAKPEDVVLIAGKGHETYQEIANTRINFDDRDVVQEVCSTHA